MKDLSVIILEDFIDSFKDAGTHMNLANSITGGGAGLGAGVGVVGSVGIWAYKRSQLQKKMKKCGDDPQCIARVKDEIKSLRNKALAGGAIATLGGAVLGGGAGAATSVYDAAKTVEKNKSLEALWRQASERERYANKKSREAELLKNKWDQEPKKQTITNGYTSLTPSKQTADYLSDEKEKYDKLASDARNEIDSLISKQKENEEKLIRKYSYAVPNQASQSSSDQSERQKFIDTNRKSKINWNPFRK